MVGYVRKFIYLLCALCLTGIIIRPIFAYSGGPPIGVSGSPDDGFRSCNVAGCHNSFALNSGNAVFSISAPSNYTLGEVVSITVSFNNSNTPKHGFQLAVLDANNEHIGTLSSVDDKTQINSIDNLNISHTLAGSDQSSWNVQWNTPSSEVNDPVTIYASGNEADGNTAPP